MAVLMAEVRAITLQICWDGLKEDLLMFVSAPGSEKLRGIGEKMSSKVLKLKQFAAWQARARGSVFGNGKRAGQVVGLVLTCVPLLAGIPGALPQPRPNPPV